VLVIVVAGLGVAVPARASCARGHARVVARSALAKVLLFGGGDAAEACVLATGRRVPIHIEFPDGPFATARRWVASIGRDRCEGLQGCDVDVVVTDLHTGHTRARWVADVEQRCLPCGNPDVTKLVIGRRGQVAWIACENTGVSGECPPGPRSILRLDGRGVTLVASAPDIARRSLRASPAGRSFSWIQAGRRRRAHWRGAPPRSPY